MNNYCFVIMPFDRKLLGIYKHAIKPVVQEYNLKCIRADEISGTGSIVRRLIEHIYHAKIIIADFTGQNPNVFYELGIAHAIGNNAIVISQSIEDVPFDVKSYRAIIYSDTAEGAENLKSELRDAINTFSEWSSKPSNPVKDFLPQEIDKKEEKLKEQLERATSKFEALEKIILQLIPGISRNEDLLKILNNVLSSKEEKDGEISFTIPKDKRDGNNRITFKKL